MEWLKGTNEKMTLADSLGIFSREDQLILRSGSIITYNTPLVGFKRVLLSSSLIGISLHQRYSR